MQFLKWILITLLLIIVVGAGGYFLYNTAYAWGETAGYDDGYSSGHGEGYTLGEQDGYDKGYNSGEEDGYTSGEQDGYKNGYALGEQDGYGEGYISGKQDGYAEGYDEGFEYGLGHGYTLRDPSYQEALTFISNDKTDENEYIEDTYGVYVCSHFSRDICNNAETIGLRCAFVELRYRIGGHTIIAFNTTDRGLVYFEPQGDEIVNPVIGLRYYQCIVPKPGYQYMEPNYDDTIKDILVIW